MMAPTTQYQEVEMQELTQVLAVEVQDTKPHYQVLAVLVLSMFVIQLLQKLILCHQLQLAEQLALILRVA
jgi:hypothetical protein